MSVIDQALKSNEQYTKAYDPRLGAHLQPAIAVVTCLDPRLSNLEGILGLKHADVAAAVRPSRTKCWGNLSLRRDARWIASSRAFPLVQGSGRAHEGTDQKGEVAFLDRQGSACERLHFRRRQRAASGSDHRRSARRLKDDWIYLAERRKVMTVIKTALIASAMSSSAPP